MLAFRFHKVAGLLEDFQLDHAKLFRFLRKIEQGYNAANPYHNRS